MPTNLLHHFLKGIIFLIIFIGLSSKNVVAIGNVNTNPDKLVGPLAFFNMDSSDVRQIDPACIIALTNGGYANKSENQGPGQWYDKVRNSPLLVLPQYSILKGADSMHHFCFGQAAKIRYYKERNPRTKKRLLDTYHSEMQYMVKHPEFLPVNWPHMKRMYLELGVARTLQKRPQIAIKDFYEALGLDPAYEQAHIALADAWTDLGQNKKALEQVSEGLRHRPDSKPLQRRFKKLGGNLPFPEPYMTHIPDEPRFNTEAGNKTSDLPQPLDRKEDRSIRNNEVPHGVFSNSNPEHNDNSQPMISDTIDDNKRRSPFCRFCP